MVAFKWDDAKALKIAKEEYWEGGRAEGKKEGRAEGLIEGAHKKLIQVVLALLKNNAPMNLITASTNLTADEVRDIAKKNGFAI